MKKLLQLLTLLLLYSFISIGQTDSLAVYTIVEKMPEFPGGDEQMMRFIQRNIQYPVYEREQKIQGKVYVTFVIDSTGKASDAKILKGVPNGKALDEEALHVISLMPLWTPGEQNGHSVNVQYNLPITFAVGTDEIRINYSPPEYEMGLDSLENYIKYQTKEVENNALGIIQICLEINKQGKVTSATLERSLIAGDAMNTSVLKAFQSINEMLPGKINRIKSDTSVCFNVFVNSKKEVIIDYDLLNKDKSMLPNEVAYLTGVINSGKNNYLHAIKCYRFAAYAGYKKTDCYYNIGAAYFNLKDTVSACREWLEAAKDSDIESATYILKNRPELAAKYGITPEHLKANRDTIMDENKTYSVVEVLPQFINGGENEFLYYIAKNFHYPREELNRGVTGTVFIQFIIRDDGTLVDASILKGVYGGTGLDNEALRVIQSSPKWKPGTQNGKPVNVYYRIPVTCKLR